LILLALSGRHRVLHFGRCSLLLIARICSEALASVARAHLRDRRCCSHIRHAEVRASESLEARVAGGAVRGTHRAFGRDHLGIRATMSTNEVSIAADAAHRLFTVQALIVSPNTLQRGSRLTRVSTSP